MKWDAIEIQVLMGALRSTCEEMGSTLIRSSYSANIKERRDCSAALFDRSGELVMQAEHIPVHLGSMPRAVESIIGHPPRPDDSWLVNDPYRGGTHLPDLTLISPVFHRDAHIGYVANRAHHADVGAEVPGSMPPHSTRLEQEGVVIPPTRVGPNVLDALIDQMREPEQRRADLHAQDAANRVGQQRLAGLATRYGPEQLADGMKAILDYSERRARAAIARLPDGNARAGERMELDLGGERRDVHLRVEVTVAGEAISLDFAGTEDQIAGNLNCPLAVTEAAAIFAIRTLTDPDAPPSAGAHRPLTVSAPEGCLLNATSPAAVAAGNVETSSRVADLVTGALGELISVPAQGQGTMNNVTLASADDEDGWTYYETLAGGQGAGSGSDGPSAIHVGMSNTLNTPVEAFETEYPVRVRILSLRRGSGGEGEHRGGDGLVRELEALEPMRFSLIGERRRLRPAGRGGGEPGKAGIDTLNGERLPAKCAGRLATGDRLRIETPGGGGFSNY